MQLQVICRLIPLKSVTLCQCVTSICLFEHHIHWFIQFGEGLSVFVWPMVDPGGFKKVIVFTVLFSHTNSAEIAQLKSWRYTILVCKSESAPTHWKTQQKGKDRSSPAVFWDLVDHMPSCLSREHYMRGQAKIPSLWMLTMKSRGDRSLVAQGARIVPVFPCKHMQTEADPFMLGPVAVCIERWPSVRQRWALGCHLSHFGGWTRLPSWSAVVNGELLHLESCSQIHQSFEV